MTDPVLDALPRLDYQEFDRSVWLPGLEPGDWAAGPANPRLWPNGGAEPA